MPFNFGGDTAPRDGVGQAPAGGSRTAPQQAGGQRMPQRVSNDVLRAAIAKIDTLISFANSKLGTKDAGTDLQADLQNIIDGNGQAFDRTTAKVDDANSRMKSIAASGRAGLLGILNAGNATAIQSQVGNQVARQARTDEQAGARALLAQVLASGQDLDVAAAQEQLNQLQETVVPGDPLAVVAPVAGAAMTAFGLWSQSQKDKKKTPNQTNQAANT